jgi:hypothetical protein
VSCAGHGRVTCCTLFDRELRRISDTTCYLWVCLFLFFLSAALIGRADFALRIWLGMSLPSEPPPCLSSGRGSRSRRRPPKEAELMAATLAAT